MTEQQPQQPNIPGDLNNPPDQPDHNQSLPLKPGDQPLVGNQQTQEGYSYRGPHVEFADPDQDTDPDGYGPQDQFGDLDDQDPYSNLEDTDPGSTPGGEGLYDLDETLYELDEPLAKQGEHGKQGSVADRHGTRGSQDQYGNQQ
jgi:hypothetical protein